MALMAPPSKGDRGAHMVKNHPAVTQRLIAMAEEAGSSSMSQYIADVLALYVGLPEHVRELNQLPIGATRKLDGLRGDSRDNRIMTRPHREVSERLAQQAAQHGPPRGQVAPYIADILALHVGLPEYVRTIDCVEEVLPLAM
ncbi:hypothetical protein O983_26190 [Mycobacterium avium 09-5983]|nr:hypothetical protein O984_24320 [Mycobacterium avium 05-4293]ETB17836.1 hypothetical protein O983_26190 [Mycobacterium avium 09-5983]